MERRGQPGVGALSAIVADDGQQANKGFINGMSDGFARYIQTWHYLSESN